MTTLMGDAELLIPVPERLGGSADSEFLKPGNGIAVWRHSGRVQEVDEFALHIFRDDVFPAASLVVHLLPIQPYDVNEKPLGQSMLPHDSRRPHPTLDGQL
jgi:hypothetical protein